MPKITYTVYVHNRYDEAVLVESGDRLEDILKRGKREVLLVMILKY